MGLFTWIAGRVIEGGKKKLMADFLNQDTINKVLGLVDKYGFLPLIVLGGTVVPYVFVYLGKAEFMEAAIASTLSVFAFVAYRMYLSKQGKTNENTSGPPDGVDAGDSDNG